MQNPFLDIQKADVLSPDQATRLFVPEACSIWEELQLPINHMIVGPRGFGKTMALRQLDHKLVANHSNDTYVGVYLQISRICTIFGSLFDLSRETANEFLKASLMHAFEDYVWLEVVREVLSYFANTSAAVHSALPNDRLNLAFGFQSDSISNAEVRRKALSAEVENAIQEWSTNPSSVAWDKRFHLSKSLDQCAEFLRSLIPDLEQNRPCLYLLLDESSPIPEECQVVLNGLLHRGRSYCVKLAIRPFEWTIFSTSTDRSIELDTDVWPLRLRYPTQSSYASQMAKVISRVVKTYLPSLEQRSDDDTVQKMFPHDKEFPYSGFDAIIQVSMGSPQNTLQICSYIFSSNEFNNEVGFAPKLQDQRVRAWSRDYEHRNPYPESREFCRSLVRKIRRENLPTIGFRVISDNEDIFLHDYVEPRIGKLIQSGFSTGFLIPIHPELATSLTEVPASFSISSGLLPVSKLPLNLPPEPLTNINSQYVSSIVKFSPRQIQKSDTQMKPLSAFLSTSFADELKQQRVDIKHSLKHVEGVSCVDVEDQLDEQFLFSTIVKKIRKCDFVIFDATIVRPYTMLEIGICASFPTRPKDVVCVLNTGVGGRAIEDLPEFIQQLPILKYSHDSRDLSELAKDIVALARELRSKKSEFSQAPFTGDSLRPRKRTNSLYLSLPPSSIRKRAIDSVRDFLESVGWRLISDEDGDDHSLNQLQVSTYCAHLTRLGIVDTSGKPNEQLLQSFRLGLFSGKRVPWRVLQVQHTSSETKGINPYASIPNLDINRWSTIEELQQLVAKFIKL